MRRASCAITALLLACLPASAAGCGQSGRVKEARSLVKSADARLYGLMGTVESMDETDEEVTFLEVVDQAEKLFAAYAEGAASDPAEVEANIRAYGEQFGLVLEQAVQAREEYGRVLALEGVEAYKEYAQYKIEMLDQIAAAVDVVARTFAQINKEIRTGKPPDAEAAQGAKRELIGIEMELSFLDEEAKSIDADRGLTR